MSNSKPNIIISVCTGGNIRVETVTSIILNMHNLGDIDLPIGILFQIGGYVDVNRNKLVETCKAREATHIMFVDADMMFPDDGVRKLLELDKDIVAGNYNMRLDPTSKVKTGPTTKMLVDGRPVSMLNKGFPRKPFKCYAAATGFMMIKMPVFDKLTMPYFDARIDEFDQHHTEDVEFCRKASEAGFDIWCDPTIKIGHIGSTLY